MTEPEPEPDVDRVLGRERDRHRRRIVQVSGASMALGALVGVPFAGAELGPADRVVLGGAGVLGLLGAAGASSTSLGGLVAVTGAGALATFWFHATRADSPLAVAAFVPLLLVWFGAAPRRWVPAAAAATVGAVLAARGARLALGTEGWHSWLSGTFDVTVIVGVVCALGWVELRRQGRERGLLREALLARTRQEARADVLRQGAERAADAARTASEHKTQFLARISHELRTPLNAILGYAELIEEEDDTPHHVRDDTAKIRSAAASLLGLVDQVLDLTAAESGRVALRVERIAVGALLAPVLDAVRPLAEAQRDRLYVQAPADAEVRVDVGRVRQVLQNLLTNAARFTEGGSIELRVRVADQLVRFDVVDTGIGIRPERLPHLFQPFVQAERETEYRYGGRGLGLAVTERTVRAMAGRIEVESAVGTGSRFSVVLPMPEVAAAEAPPSAA